MRIECIAIGTELLTTRRMDTNSVWLAEQLASMGLGFHRKTAVGDSREDLLEAFREAVHRSDLIVTTGGLGPTFDDFTKEVFAELFKVALQEDAGCKSDLEAWYAARKRIPAQNNYKQVMIPLGATPLKNPVGSAPGVYWQDPPGFPGKRIVMLPGVPREMKRMWQAQVEPRLMPLMQAPVSTRRAVVAGVPESTLDERTQAIRDRFGDLEWTILASLTQVEFLLRHQDEVKLESAVQALRDELTTDLAAEGEANLEDAVLAHLKRRGEHLALAESLTGGLLASRLTAIPGASEALLGSAVVYTPAAKQAFGGLEPSFLAQHGSISQATTAALAWNVRERLASSWGLAITGNAGPSTDANAPGDHPVGQVFVAIVGPDVEEVKELSLAGDRSDIQLRACGWALDFLRRKLI
jgi:nicotinamide-nucleotide amidase